MTYRVIHAMTLAAWLSVTFSACVSEMGPRKASSRNIVAAQEAANDHAQQMWQERRVAALKSAEAEARVLARARATLSGNKNLGIPRDAAICFEARNIMQRDLDAAMRSGGEFGPEIDDWHNQSKGVEMFCTYALTIGLPE